jgi:hypothetical protein
MSTKESEQYDRYEWIKKYGIWLVEVTKEDGEKMTLPEGVVPSRAPCRFDSVPDYRSWKRTIDKKAQDSGSDVAAR